MSAVRWKGGWSGSGSPTASLITYYNGDSVLYLNISNNLFNPISFGVDSATRRKRLISSLLFVLFSIT